MDILTPAFVLSGSLPGRVAITENCAGIGMLAGRPEVSTGSICSLIVTASNGLPSDATQALTLTMQEAAEEYLRIYQPLLLRQSP